MCKNWESIRYCKFGLKVYLYKISVHLPMEKTIFNIQIFLIQILKLLLVYHTFKKAFVPMEKDVNISMGKYNICLNSKIILSIFIDRKIWKLKL